ncbi:MAG: TauD/TfdA family dioxygenase [Pseudomonadota bacterium]
MALTIEPLGAACGARLTGVDLSAPVSPEIQRAVRRAWLEHKVLVFPDQPLSPENLPQAARNFGPIGDDPFFESISAGSPVVAICRRADETAPVFAEAWHTDWSFKVRPPAGTLLFGVTIPPVGGNTSFINQELVLAQMPADLRRRLDGLIARHSAKVAYAPEGTYGEADAGSDRSMKIRIDASARAVQTHPLIIRHPETGARVVYSTLGYICGIEGMADEAATALLHELYQWQTQPQFQYHHRWEPNMLVLWDNRAVLHKANGGFDGYERLLYRVTIADDPAFYLDGAAA